MGLFSPLPAPDDLSLGGSKTLIHLAIAGFTFCSRALDLYLSMSTPSSSYSTHGNINYVAAAKVIANRVGLATGHASLIATATSSPTIQAARATPIKLFISTAAIPTSSHLGYTIGFLAIFALLTVLAGTAVLHSTTSAVVQGHTGENSSSPSINQSSTDNTHASDIPPPRLGRRSGGSGGDEPFSSSDASDAIANDDNGSKQFRSSGRGGPPPPDGPPPPSPPTEDPEDDDYYTDDFWAMILKNMLFGVLVGRLIRGIRAFNRHRYFEALRRAGKIEQDSVMAMPGKSLDAAAVFFNGTTSVSLYGMSPVRASLSESVSLCQTTIAIAGLLSLDSSVQKFSSVPVPVVKTPMSSCSPRHGLENLCFTKPKGASRSMDSAPRTENAEPTSVPRRQPAAHKSDDHETTESPIQIKPAKDLLNILTVICGLYLIAALVLIPSLFLSAGFGSSSMKDRFNNAERDWDRVDAPSVSAEAKATGPPLVREATPASNQISVPSSRFTLYPPPRPEKPEGPIPKELLEEVSRDNRELCRIIDNFIEASRNTNNANGSCRASPICHDHEALPGLQNVQDCPLTHVVPDPVKSDDDEQVNGVTAILPQAASSSKPSGSTLENATHPELSHRTHLDISEDLTNKAEDLALEIPDIANQTSTSTPAERDGHEDDESTGLSASRSTSNAAPNGSCPASPIRLDHEPLLESPNVQQCSLPHAVPDPFDDELVNDAKKQPNDQEDLASAIWPQASSPSTFSRPTLENAADLELSHTTDLDISEDPVTSNAKDLLTETSIEEPEIANQTSTSTAAQRDGHKEDEPTGLEEEATPQLEVVISGGVQETGDVISEIERVQLNREAISTWPLETATEGDVAVGKTPADFISVDETPVNDAPVNDTPVDDILVSDTSLLPPPPAAILPPLTTATPPAVFPPRSPPPNSSTSSAEVEHSSAASRFPGKGRRGGPGSAIDLTGTSSNAEQVAESTFSPHTHRETVKKARRGKRGIKKKKKSSSSAGDGHSETTGTSHLSDAGGRHSQPTDSEDNGDASVHGGQHPEPDAPLAAPEPVRVQRNGKGKEKDLSEYPNVASTTAEASCSQPLLGGTVNGASSEDLAQTTLGNDNSSPPIDGPSIATYHVHGQDPVIGDGFIKPRGVGKGKERENELATEISTSELSNKTAETTDGGIQSDLVERHMFHATDKPGNGKGKGKEKDPSEYPATGPSTENGARLPSRQTRDLSRDGSSGLPGSGKEKQNGPMGQHNGGLQSTGSWSSIHAPSALRPGQTEPASLAPRHDQRMDTGSTPSSTRRSDKGKRKDTQQRVPQSSVAGSSTAASLPRHGKRRRLEQLEPATEHLERSGTSLLDSIYAPRPALPSSRPPPNPLLHPELAAAVPNASPSGIPLSQFGGHSMVQLDLPSRTATTHHAPVEQPAPTRADTPPPARMANPGEPPMSPLSPRLPARTMDLDYDIGPRRRPVQPRSQSVHPDPRAALSSPDRSVRRCSSFSSNFRLARQVTVPWDEEVVAGGSRPQRPASPDFPPSPSSRDCPPSPVRPPSPVCPPSPVFPPSPVRPQTTAHSRWAPRNLSNVRRS